ncbi:hypothetical protein EJ110_NYTH01679 [Nymphaea thermarum]|nr:hypothetical protein EJ110_NYTH01679 [Nymphaea thermarum]
MKLVNNYELSPEVFLRESSFLEWWGLYERKLGAAGYYSPRIPLELPQGSQEQGAVIRWWSKYEEEAEPAGEHCSSNIHVRFWNGLGLSSEGFLETKSEFMARWRKEQGLNPADTSPFAYFMKGKEGGRRREEGKNRGEKKGGREDQTGGEEGRKGRREEEEEGKNRRRGRRREEGNEGGGRREGRRRREERRKEGG